MKAGPSVRFWSFSRTALFSGVLCAAAFQLCNSIGFRINTSPSLPIGLYKVTAATATNLIEFCPPEPFAALSLVRGYRSSGSCADGGAPLLKPIVAKPGDRVAMSSSGIAVNGILLPNTTPLARDSKGRPLKPWRFGSSVVATGMVWVASSFNSRSFDSRYFGPIGVVAVRYSLKPVLTL